MIFYTHAHSYTNEHMHVGDTHSRCTQKYTCNKTNQYYYFIVFVFYRAICLCNHPIILTFIFKLFSIIYTVVVVLAVVVIQLDNIDTNQIKLKGEHLDIHVNQSYYISGVS